MRAIITGMNGTVAPELASVVEADDGSVVVWDREKVSPDNLVEVQRFIRLSKADAFFHVATGDPAWAADPKWVARRTR